MPNIIIFLMLVFIYFVLVYLGPVRRGQQSLLLWLILILVQAASVFCFHALYGYASQLSFLAGVTDTVRQCLVIGILIIINLALIFVLNLAFYKEEGDSEVTSSVVIKALGAARNDVTVAATDVAMDDVVMDDVIVEATDVATHDVAVEAVDVATDNVTVEATGAAMNDVTSEVVDEVPNDSEMEMDIDNFPLNITQEPIQNQGHPAEVPPVTPENQSAAAVDEMEIFDSIQTMMDNGQTDEAIQYLRMIAYFGTNEALMARAQELLQTMENNK